MIFYQRNSKPEDACDVIPAADKKESVLVGDGSGLSSRHWQVWPFPPGILSHIVDVALYANVARGGHNLPGAVGSRDASTAQAGRGSGEVSNTYPTWLSSDVLVGRKGGCLTTLI